MAVDLMETFPTHAGDGIYEGLVKLKLAHADGLRVLLPECVMLDIQGWAWFQRQYFSACLLRFLADGGYGQFSIDTESGARLFIGFTQDRLVRRWGVYLSFSNRRPRPPRTRCVRYPSP